MTRYSVQPTDPIFDPIFVKCYASNTDPIFVKCYGFFLLLKI